MKDCLFVYKKWGGKTSKKNQKYNHNYKMKDSKEDRIYRSYHTMKQKKKLDCFSICACCLLSLLGGHDNRAVLVILVRNQSPLIMLLDHGILQDSITSSTAEWVSGEIMFSDRWKSWMTFQANRGITV